ncbi:hypothetical protein EI94DRAFT_1786775 [Lactarius quietus]|nr:hypothetical protein EI94DRAFT_1786775 [Lactarius quietus]
MILMMDLDLDVTAAWTRSTCLRRKELPFHPAMWKQPSSHSPPLRLITFPTELVYYTCAAGVVGTKVPGYFMAVNLKMITVDHFADLKALRERLEEGRAQHNQWHSRLSKGIVSTIADLQRVTSELAGDTSRISAQADSFAAAVPKFREALLHSVRASADSAISSVVVFGDALLQLSAGHTTVAHTRRLALRTQHEFHTVHEHTRKALALATDLGVEITYWRTHTEVCAHGVNECHALAGRFAEGAEAQLALVQERISVSQRDSSQAVEAYNSARRHRERCEDARTIRNLLTFGLGEVLDIGGFTRSVENAGRTMHTAQANQRAAEGQRDSASAELNARRAEQGALKNVSTQLQALGSALALAASALDEHRARLTDGTNAAFAVSVFFGGLVARTAAWDVIASAPALAGAVKNLQKFLDANTGLTGAFVTSPALLNDELKRLADSNIPLDEPSALM